MITGLKEAIKIAHQRRQQAEFRLDMARQAVQSAEMVWQETIAFEVEVEKALNAAESDLRYKEEEGTNEKA